MALPVSPIGLSLTFQPILTTTNFLASSSSLFLLDFWPCLHFTCEGYGAKDNLWMTIDVNVCLYLLCIVYLQVCMGQCTVVCVVKNPDVSFKPKYIHFLHFFTRTNCTYFQTVFPNFQIIFEALMWLVIEVCILKIEFWPIESSRVLKRNQQQKCL